MSYRIEFAREFARIAHGSQVRRYVEIPYVTHVYEVAKWVSAVLKDEDAIIAAILHDTVEDTSVTADDLERYFGPRVRSLVLEVTDVSKPSDGNRAVRKDLDRAHLAKASPEGKTIKLADMISNTRSISMYDPKFALTYLREKSETLPLLREGDPVLFEVCSKLLDYANSQLVLDMLPGTIEK